MPSTNTIKFSAFLLIITTLSTLPTNATPLPNTTPNLPNTLTRRNPSPVPVSASAFTDWPTNVIMLGGSQIFGLWIPPDGKWYNLCDISCLDLPAYAIGKCCSTTIDNIGVAAGNGPCSFVGSEGWSDTLSGEAGEGYHTVGPPQTIILAACG